MSYNENEDGVTHINVYSKGKTELGRFLSNFSLSPIETEDGHFNSIEGYWYWLGTNSEKKDELRKLHGFQAKQVGRELRGNDWNDDLIFKEKILKAIKIKINSNKNMKKILLENKLPLTHYYVYDGKSVGVPGSKWIIDGIENMFKRDIF